MVSKPTWLGGLEFGFKWNMGWMHHTLEHMSKDPLYRTYHHNQVLFILMPLAAIVFKQNGERR